MRRRDQQEESKAQYAKDESSEEVSLTREKQTTGTMP